MKTARELRAERATILNQARALVEAAEGENRNLTADEKTKFDGFQANAAELEERAVRLETLPGDLPQAPAVLKIARGDTEERAFSHFFKTGDDGGIRSLRSGKEDGLTQYTIDLPRSYEARATDEIMNVAADADGKSAVPTGFVPRIAARRGAIDLSARLGCQIVPGQGTTVNFPYENADPAVFAATSEQVDALSNTYERDRPTLATKAFTLAKKTKKVVLTEELMEDEDAGLMAFLGDHIGRAIGLTKNALLLTEVAASGTALKTFASASAIAVGEPEDLVFHDTLSYYLDDVNSIGWVMKPSTFGAIKKLTGDARLYEAQVQGSRGSLLEYPVNYSGSAGAITASGKSLYFGNWWAVGMREGNSLSFIRDPYTTDGVVYLKYSFRIVFGVLIAGAIGYGVHPTG